MAGNCRDSISLNLQPLVAVPSKGYSLYTKKLLKTHFFLFGGGGGRGERP